MDIKGITIPIGTDMQGLYDGLILYRDSINAQIDVLSKSPSICTHKTTEDIGKGITVCSNNCCGKIINGGEYDYCK